MKSRLDEEQLKKISAGIKNSDRKAFDQLFRTLYSSLVQMAYRYIRHKSGSTDIVQDAFVKLWQKRQDLDPEQSVIAYLHTIVRNLSLNYIRDHSRESTGLREERIPENLHHLSDENERNEQTELLRRWITELPERQRTAFNLSRFEGLDHEEIALEMKISSRTVNNHIVTALNTLRKRHEAYTSDMKSARYG